MNGREPLELVILVGRRVEVCVQHLEELPLVVFDLGHLALGIN